MQAQLVTLATGVADSDILLIQHHQLLMKYAAQPSSSIIASSADIQQINLVTDVHCNRSICAQSKYKRSDVHNTNASISGCLM